MEFTDKEFCLEVWGEMACFTRPEFKVERVSYDIITPSAARAIFEAIFWKPAIRWEITRIEVLRPIKWNSIRRNEVGACASPKVTVYIEDKHQQRNTLLLKDVRYRIYAKMIFVPASKRSASNAKHHPGDDENPMKYYEMFTRRARAGQCFNQPYLGTRECSASFQLIESEADKSDMPILESRDLGIMLYDMDYSNPKNIIPMFFRATMEHGVIEVPERNSKMILR